MSMRESQGQIIRAMEELLLHWDRTRDTWRDVRARQFEHEVLEPLQAKVVQAAKVMERMSVNLQRARSECGPLSDFA